MNPMFAIAVGLVSIVTFVHCDECTNPDPQALLALLNQTTTAVTGMYMQAPNGTLVKNYVNNTVWADIKKDLLELGQNANNSKYMGELAQRLVCNVESGMKSAFAQLDNYNNSADKPGAVVKMGVFATAVKFALEKGIKCNKLYPVKVKDLSIERTRYHCQTNLTLTSLKEVLPVLKAANHTFWYNQHVDMLDYCTKLFSDIDRHIFLNLNWPGVFSKCDRAEQYYLVTNTIGSLNAIAVRNLGDVSQQCVNKP